MSGVKSGVVTRTRGKRSRKNPQEWSIVATAGLFCATTESRLQNKREPQQFPAAPNQPKTAHLFPPSSDGKGQSKNNKCDTTFISSYPRTHSQYLLTPRHKLGFASRPTFDLTSVHHLRLYQPLFQLPSAKSCFQFLQLRRSP